MQLLLFRHGIAESRDGDKPDAERRLTDEGVDRTKAAAKGLASFVDSPERILTSPKTRAKETADIVAKALKREVETWPVVGDGDANDVARELEGRTEARLMLVGHEPTFSELVELLCFTGPHGATDLKKAGCAILEVDPENLRRGGTLQALLPAKVLRRLAGKK